MPKPNPHHRLLLAAMRPRDAELASIIERRGNEIDWDWLLGHVVAHKLDPLLAHRVQQSGVAESIPVTIRERLRAASRQALDRHTKALRDLELVDDRLRRAGVPYILVKGPVLGERIYDTPAQRGFFDLDIVVRKPQVDAAQEALEGLGYELWGGRFYFGFVPATAADLERATRLMRSSLKRFAHEIAFVAGDERLLPIDLHWQLLPRGRMRADATEALWESVTTAMIGGTRVSVLSPEAMLLHLAMHCWSNRPWSFALLHLTDVAWALDRLPLDPERLLRLADRWGGWGDLARSLYVLGQVLGMTLPPAMSHMAGAVTDRFKRLATFESLLETKAHPAPSVTARLRQEIDWGLAMGSLRSTGMLLFAKYTALARYYGKRF